MRRRQDAASRGRRRLCFAQTDGQTGFARDKTSLVETRPAAARTRCTLVLASAVASAVGCSLSTGCTLSTVYSLHSVVSCVNANARRIFLIQVPGRSRLGRSAFARPDDTGHGTRRGPPLGGTKPGKTCHFFPGTRAVPPHFCRRPSTPPGPGHSHGALPALWEWPGAASRAVHLQSPGGTPGRTFAAMLAA